MKLSKTCYVYAYRVDGELWIIGKGHGGRDRKHLARARRFANGLPLHRIYGWQRELADRLKAGATVTIERLAENLDEADALALERRLIAELRPLKNRLPGGEGGRILRRGAAISRSPGTSATAIISYTK